MDAKTDFYNNRRDSFADSNYGSEDSWNDYISLAKTSLVDLMSPHKQGLAKKTHLKQLYSV